MARIKVIVSRTTPDVTATKLRYMAVRESPVAARKKARIALIPSLTLKRLVFDEPVSFVGVVA
jgi:hypothetical protein